MIIQTFDAKVKAGKAKITATTTDGSNISTSFAVMIPSFDVAEKEITVDFERNDPI